MYTRVTLISFVLLFTLAIAISAVGDTTTHWAVTTSIDKVFVVKYENGTVASYQAASISGSFFTGVSSYNGYVFVADKISVNGTSTAVLRVGHVVDLFTDPAIEWVGEPIVLAQGNEVLRDPKTVTVDSNGGIYVIGGRYQDNYNKLHSNYAYITSSNNWAGANVSVVNLQTTSLADIDTLGTQAMIAHRDLYSGVIDQTWVTRVDGSTVMSTQNLDDQGYLPSAIAAGTNGYTYIANGATEDDPEIGLENIGSISIMDNDLMFRVGPAFQLDTFRPTDISFFTLNGVNYLGLVGDDEGFSQAIRLTLGEDGLPLPLSGLYHRLDASTDHFCTVSADGSLMWATNPQTNTVTALDTLTWTSHTEALPGAAGYIAMLTSREVPEPASALALFTGIIGLAGYARMRRTSRF